MESPYTDGSLFHGPTFQLQESLRMGQTGSSALLRVTRAIDSHWDVSLLDAATHGIPHDSLHQWSDEIPKDVVAYPAFIPEFKVHSAPPRVGTQIRCEVRFDGFHATKQLPRFRVQLIAEGGHVWCTFRAGGVALSEGTAGFLEKEGRQSFLRDRSFVPGLALSKAGVVKEEDIARSNWLPGTIETLYGASDANTVGAAEAIAAKVGVHPQFAAKSLPLNPSSSLKSPWTEECVPQPRSAL